MVRIRQNYVELNESVSVCDENTCQGYKQTTHSYSSKFKEIQCRTFERQHRVNYMTKVCEMNVYCFQSCPRKSKLESYIRAGQFPPVKRT